MCLTRRTAERDPRQGSPIGAWMGGATEKDWPKRPSDRQLQEVRKKTDRAITSALEAVRVPAVLASPASLQANQLHHLHTWLSVGQSCHRQKKSCVYACRVALVLSDSLRPCKQWPARLLCQGGGFSKQEYWSILANTGCHTLLEHYISCCPSFQLPWVPGAARTPANQAAIPSPHLTLTGANPSPPGQPQGQTPVDDPHAEVEVKPQLKPRAVWLRKKTPKPSHQLYKLTIKSTQSIMEIPSLRNI